MPLSTDTTTAPAGLPWWRPARSQTALLCALALVAAACGSDEQPDVAAAPAGDESGDAGATEVEDGLEEHAELLEHAAENDAHVVDIRSGGHHFDLPDEIPSGWTTFRYHNDSDETHFALIGDLPQGITADDSREEVVPPFQDGMDLILDGDAEAGFAALERLPAWSEETVFVGGPGFIAPGGVAETTVYLEPGNHQVECYIKTDGVFHTEAMLADFEVTDDDSGASEPEADFEVRLANDGIEIDGEVESGTQTFAVHVDEQMVHGNGLWHDVHVARVDGEQDTLDELAAWMSWATPEGLDVPAPVTFVGGAQSMPEGHTAYVTIDFDDGDYAFVAEVDEPDEKGMLHTVTVGDDQ